MTMRWTLAAMAAAAWAAPAFAATGVSIPEPGAAGLFALGVIGLIVGRQAARRRPPE